MSGPAIAGRGFTTDHLMQYVRMPLGVMPSYPASILSEGELLSIAEYASGMAPGKPISEIPLLDRFVTAAATGKKPIPVGNQNAGGAIYQKYCAACHGARKKGGIGPDLRAEA